MIKASTCTKTGSTFHQVFDRRQRCILKWKKAMAQRSSNQYH